MTRQAELLTWIDQTRRLQRRLACGFAALAVVVAGLLAWRAAIGGFALVFVALVAVCSFWVTAAHNAAHRQKLDELARIERNGGRPLTTDHRRWRSPRTQD